jgi:hypothetical protein
MKTLVRLLAVAVAVALACGGSSALGASARPASAAPLAATLATPRPNCPPLPAPRMHCMSQSEPDTAMRTALADGAAARPSGWGADEIASAYRLPLGQGQGQTIAVVDAFDAPTVESDLAEYRSTYNLPACTTANGCFRKVNQRGDTSPQPEPDAGWAVEIALDVQMVSAGCPNCHILLVEADSNEFADLGAAVDTAVRLGADVVSNSYGGQEDGEEYADLARFYSHPGHVLTVSSGDAGFGPADLPAAFAGVVAVGGTTLSRAPETPRGWSETVWEFASSGCSAYVPKPRWQHDPHCGMRTVADVAAVADDVAVYDTFEEAGWLEVGGTSVSAPLIGAVYGLAGNAATVTPAYPYRHRSHLFDVTSGSNAQPFSTCGHDYLCNGRKGYDGPTGVGTPDGTGAF